MFRLVFKPLFKFFFVYVMNGFRQMSANSFWNFSEIFYTGHSMKYFRIGYIETSIMFQS